MRKERIVRDRGKRERAGETERAGGGRGEQERREGGERGERSYQIKQTKLQN